MLKLGFKSDFGAPLARLQKMMKQAQDLTPLFRRWSKVLREDAKARIASGEGFAPLAESTQKRLQHTRASAITVQGKVRTSYAKRLAGYLARQVKSGKLEKGVLSDLKQLMQGGREALSFDLSDRRAKSLVRLQKQFKQVHQGKRVGGEKRQSGKHKILGKLGGTLIAKAESNQAICESRVPWSKVHNEGGTAGHGAQIPARQFFVFSPNLKQKLEKLTLQHFLLTYEEEE